MQKSFLSELIILLILIVLQLTVLKVMYPIYWRHMVAELLKNDLTSVLNNFKQLPLIAKEQISLSDLVREFTLCPVIM